MIVKALPVFTHKNFITVFRSKGYLYPTLEIMKLRHRDERSLAQGRPLNLQSHGEARLSAQARVLEPSTALPLRSESPSTCKWRDTGEGMTSLRDCRALVSQSD